MSDPEALQEISNIGDLIEALREFPSDARLIVSCMDGTDRIYLRYEEQFNYVMVSG